MIPVLIIMMGEMALAGAEPEFGLRDFGRWMESEQRRIFLLCRRMLQDEEEASSAAQDAFLKAYQALSQGEDLHLDDPARWITRIAVNTCLDRLRSRKWRFWRQRPKAEDERYILERTAQTSPGAEDRFFAGEIRVRLGQALDRLSVRQRAVFTLRHYEDLSLEQIAAILDLDVGTVKAHMFRAVQKLREELRDLYGRGSESAT